MDQRAHAEREGQAVGRLVLVDRGHGLKKRQYRVRVRPRDARGVGVWHRRVDRATARGGAIVHGTVELVLGPGADAGVLLGGEVGTVDRAERGVEREAAAEKPPALARVAGSAIT